MASGPTFESDLRAVREARGLSLTEIHQQTRIPVDVLRRFEDGELVQDPTYNQVYLKAFMQSYARAVGVPPGTVLVAYEDQLAGAYRGALHPSRPEPEAPSEAPAPPAAPEPGPSDAGPPEPEAEAPTPPPAPKAEAPKAEAPKPETTRKADPAPKAPPAATQAPPAVAALKKTPDREAAKAAPKTLAEARGSRPAIPTTDKTFDKNWTTIVGLFVVVLVLIAGALWWLVFSGDDEPDTDAPIAEVDPATVEPDSAAAPPPTPSGPALQIPITVGLTAGGDGLQSFRVTVDDGDRRPYWIEIGDTETFTAQQSVTLWGEDPTGDFSEATVEIQGLEFTPPNGRPFVISAANGQAVLDSLAAR